MPDQTHIVYYDGVNQDLKYARWNGSAWSIQTVDAAGNVGVYPSLVLDSSGRPHISYSDRDSHSLKYAVLNGGNWVLEVVGAGMGSYFEHSSIALDKGGVPHIAYYGAGDLKFASRAGGYWSTETLDSDGTVGSFCSLKFDNLGNPHIGYWSFTAWQVRHATRQGSAWQRTDVGSGSYSFLALDRGDHPHIIYWDGTAARYAWYDGQSWNAEAIGSVGMEGGQNWRFSIATNTRGQPGVGYAGTGTPFTYAQRELGPSCASAISPAGGVLSGPDGAVIALPPAAVTQTVVITYTPRIVSGSGELASAGYAFDLAAVYSNTGGSAHLVMGRAFTVVVTYTNIGPIIESDKLGLYWWDEQTHRWSQQGITSTVNISSNVITAQVGHFSLFAILGETRRVFLPIVLRYYQ